MAHLAYRAGILFRKAGLANAVGFVKLNRTFQDIVYKPADAKPVLGEALEVEETHPTQLRNFFVARNVRDRGLWCAEVVRPVTEVPGLDQTVIENLPDTRILNNHSLKERRRMRSNKLHYLDNPEFSLLVLITPYEAPPADEETTGTSAAE